MISWLRFGETTLDDKYRQRGLDALVLLRVKNRGLFQPSDEATIIQALERVASVFQVAAPEPEAQIIYALVLSEIPPDLMKKAVLRVCATHKYKNMPIPADFRTAVQDELWQVQWLAKNLDKWIAQLISA